MDLIILPSSFEEVRPIWQQRLWDSKYKFEPVSCMLFMGGYDLNIPKNYTPFFLKAVCNGDLAGVVSAHQTSAEHFRLRGVYVFEQFRNQDVASALILHATEIVKTFNVELLWAAPRVSNVGLFEKLNFVRNSEPTNEGFLYGPNCYVSKSLK